MGSRKCLFKNTVLDPETGCWNWDWRHPSVRPQGRFLGRKEMVSRIVAHLYLKMPMDSPLFVCHTCDNKYCVNPKHLYLGTQLDNMRDRDTRGRNAHSKKTHCSNGHPFTEANTYAYVSGTNWGLSRHCKTCATLRQGNRPDPVWLEGRFFKRPEPAVQGSIFEARA